MIFGTSYYRDSARWRQIHLGDILILHGAGPSLTHASQDRRPEWLDQDLRTSDNEPKVWYR
ncbi:hypothetical protein BDR04DRAFT_1098861 [Suillus decipiens]|nr:hypothetical protein BDR04DRAFT_1098861 [Suillus decipiens]